MFLKISMGAIAQLSSNPWMWLLFHDWYYKFWTQLQSMS